MTDLPEHAHGIRIGNVNHDNKVRCYMVNDGKYTYWVQYDRDQLKGLLAVVETRLNEMKALEGKMSDYKSWQCQKCGDPIGWLGRIFMFFHKCRELR